MTTKDRKTRDLGSATARTLSPPEPAPALARVQEGSGTQTIDPDAASSVQDSEETSGLPATWAAEEANLETSTSAPSVPNPSVSGMSAVAYKSSRLPGEPCAWLRVNAPWRWHQSTQGIENSSSRRSLIVSR